MSVCRWAEVTWLALFLLQLLPGYMAVSTSSLSDSNHGSVNVTNDESSSLKEAAVITGDIVLGGLFPVHKKGTGQVGGQQCGEIQGDRGIQRAEAMLFSIDVINNDPNILPDVTLGANILDTCSRDTYALEQSLEYVRASLSSMDASEFSCPGGSVAVPKNAAIAVAGVVGGSYSSVSIQVANLLRLFKIPQVSYASTSTALSDKSRFELFARTVPPDNFQAKAMADIVQFFNWTYVSTVASEGDYGEAGMDSIWEEMRARNICLAVTEKMSQSATDKQVDLIITRLLLKPTARVVLLFLRVDDAKELLLAARRQNVTNHFIWVAADGWGIAEMPVKNNDIVAEGALTIDLQNIPMPEFDTYFQSLSPRKNKRNPWYTEYWEKVHDCQFEQEGDTAPAQGGDSEVRICTGMELITPRVYKQETKVPFVYDAVYAVAHALHNMLQDECGHFKGRRKRKRCMKDVKIDGHKLYHTYLLNVSFDNGYSARVQFDHQGDGLGRYNIMNYRRNRSTLKYEYYQVGKWANGLQMTSQVTWAGGTYEVPTSQCSAPCGEGQIKNPQTGETCCWVCTTCQDWEYVRDEETCEDCGNGWWPHPDKTGCHSLPIQTIEWTSVYAIVPICLSIMGTLLTLLVMATFLRHINTPIVKASGRELSFLLLSGFLVCYLMTFVLLAAPSPLICGIQRFGVGFGFSMTYASLLTKTNRISRIFDSASRSAKRPPFISPKSQLVITLLLICVQIVCTCVWLVLEPPGIRHYNPNGKRNQIILKCHIKDESFLISLVYNMLLIIVCTVYAVKTRKIPENFNESKFIGFTMYTTCIIWLSFVPIYFGTLNSIEIQVTTLCVSISLSAFVALMCLFTPKMYIIVFQPQKNVRRLTMNSATYKKAAVASSSLGGANGPPSEHIHMDSARSPLRAGGATTETETDRDSMASLEDC